MFLTEGGAVLMTTVYRWTGREAKLLRQALLLSIHDFAAHLGVGERTVNKWEALAESLTSARGIDCLRDLYRQMQPYVSVPAVGDFLERARGIVAA